MIVVVDYQMGNLGSIANILRKLGAEAMVSADPAIISQASKLVLPGVGAFDEGMTRIEELGLREVLTRRVLDARIPTLGICLGMQLMARASEEGVKPGLGWISGDVKRFRFASSAAQPRIPHMGWNNVKPAKSSTLFAGFESEPRFYFVHSYHVVCDNYLDVLATAYHGYEFVAGLERDNLAGVQFHPEKSHKFGMTLFRNFVERF